MAANADDVKAALKDLAASNQRYKGKKTQLSSGAFDTLVSDVSTWLEKKGKNGIDGEADRKLVARVVLHDPSMAANYMAAPNGQIGTYSKPQLPSLVQAAAATPAYTDLGEKFSFKTWPAVRVDVARVLVLADKGHSTHGSNFKGDQTLKQVIDNLLEKVQGGPETQRVHALLRKHYPGYL